MCDGTTAQPGSCTVLVVLCLAHGGDNALHMEVTRELDHSQTKIKHFTVAFKSNAIKLCILFDNTHTFNPAVVDLSI